jgi:predicted acetyltransferase
MKHKGIQLVEPSVKLEEEFMAMVAEFTANGEHNTRFYNPTAGDFRKFVQGQLSWKKGENLPDGWVPASTFWLVSDDGVVLGTTSIRYELTEFLRNIGGQIGYNIRPGQRRKGYGTVILALTLQEAKKLGLERVLVTCDEDNVGSMKIIEQNGGKLEDIYTLCETRRKNHGMNKMISGRPLSP